MTTLSLPSSPRLASPTDQAAGDPPARQLNSRELLQGNRTIEISHNGSIYRLYTTKLGKLILTK